jgi:hypothetical protein
MIQRGMIHFWRALQGPLAGGVFAACFVSSVAAEPVQDDFQHGHPAAHWFVCNRHENEFHFGQVPGEARTAATAIVRPGAGSNRAGQALPDAPAKHGGCLYKNNELVTDGPNDRAELWEADAVWLPLGTDVWYRFDMFIDGAIPRNAGRLVIGQWKQSNAPGDASPVLAQRFGGRFFTVTTQQDDEGSDQGASPAECRISIAAQAGAGTASDKPASRERPARHLLERRTAPDAQVAVDRHEPISDDTLRPLEAPACGRDISVTTYNPLPDPFDAWTTMVYRLRIGPNGDGLVEIWANGAKISRTTGRIGLRSAEEGRQYFKFGPYRDQSDYATLTRLSRYRRGLSRADVDPDGMLTPD